MAAAGDLDAAGEDGTAFDEAGGEDFGVEEAVAGAVDLRADFPVGVDEFFEGVGGELVRAGVEADGFSRRERVGIGCEKAAGDFWEVVKGFLVGTDGVACFYGAAESGAFVSRVAVEGFFANPSAGGSEVSPESVLGGLKTEDGAFFEKTGFVGGELVAEWAAVVGEPEVFGDAEGGSGGEFEGGVVWVVGEDLICGDVAEGIDGSGRGDTVAGPVGATEVLESETAAELEDF